MAACVVLAADGTLQPTGQPVAQCTGYVLASGSENAQATVLQEIFKWPTPEVATAFFTAAFGIVLACNVAGYVVGAVVKMVSTERD